MLKGHFSAFLSAFLVLTLGACSTTTLNHNQIIAKEQSTALELLQEDIKTDELFNDISIDPKKAVVITKVFSFGRDYIRLNGIPIPKGEIYRTSALLFSNINEPDIEFVAAGPEYHVYQVPAGQYYLARVAAGMPIIVANRTVGHNTFNYIKGSALDEEGNPQYGSINLQEGEVVYLGDIQTYGTAVDIKLYPNFNTSDKQLEMKAFLKQHFPNLETKVTTRLFTVQQPDPEMQEILQGIEPERLKTKRLNLEKKLSKHVNLEAESRKHHHLSKQYIERLSKDKDRIKTYKEIYNLWLNDPQLFDAIEKHALDYAKRYEDTDTNKGEAHWAFRALASSGLQKYRSTFEAIQQMSGSAKRSQQALKYLNVLNERTLLSRDIHSDSYLNEEWDWQQQHSANMIASSSPHWRIKGASSIIRNEYYDKPMLDHISDVLISSVKSNKFDKYDRKFQLLLAKALARCKDIRYRKVLQQLMDLSSDSKVKDYAEEYIEYLEDSVD
ncbi:hypothetical protein [uncultured Pseudoteredinibacter sp.]|uniref:hypothetical protein n=1 Tax=uncultured Pseudoteredinibacter sp. TaxID=1641701 RepID=UPI00263833AD|nr:hypothetical protein [uncultured Pseudoteredinibacter sp.]